MPQATTLSLLALVTTLGGIVGTQLGRDAVAEMNPIFFNERPEPATFHQDYQAMPTVLPTGPGWDYPYDWARDPVCWGCPGQPDPYLDAYVEPFVDPVDAPIPTAGKAVVRVVGTDPSMDEAGQPSERSSVDRYARFPVTEDEARRLRHIVELQRGRTAQAGGGLGREAEQAVGM